MKKLNNKGQTLVMFVVLIPLFIMVFALIVDVSYMTHEKIKLENTTKIIIKEMYEYRLDNDIEDRIINLYRKNNIKDNNIKIETNEKYMIISNNYSINSIFGKVIGLKKYKLKIVIKGYKENNYIKIVKE